MPIHIAVIGAGPSGFYTAGALLQNNDECRVDILEALPTPYGLIRAGVAPDHQSTKRVSRVFERTAKDVRVGYYGNVILGRDVSLDELRSCYDAVVIATGAPLDRPLNIPGSDATGVYGSAAFVGWYNAHPDYSDLNPNLDTSAVVIIGNGNVAIDVARVLLKTPAEMAESDLAAHASEKIHNSPIEDVYLVGRRGPSDAKFTNKELDEMGNLETCFPIVDVGQLPDTVEGEMRDHERVLKEQNIETLREFSSRPPADKRKRVHFLFCANPEEVLNNGRVQGVRFETMQYNNGETAGTGEFFDISCGAVISAIGYRMQPLDDLPTDMQSGVLTNQEGHVSEGVYVVGWARRGPSGVIGTNKGDGAEIAAKILEDVHDSGRIGGEGLEALFRERAVHWLSFTDWEKIDASEVAAAPSGSPRQKYTRIDEMLEVVGDTCPGA